MIIEIRGTGFVNKGAELMLRAIVARLRTAYPDAILVMATSPAGGARPFRRVVDAGLYPKAWLYWCGIQWGHAAALVPRKLREMHGVICDREVDVVLDAAGFAYSDQWGSRHTRELAHATNKWRKRGTKIVLMPQAFGPFTSERTRRYMRKAVANADLVMPRERTSYGYLVSLAGEREKIRQFPDFTNLIDGTVPDGYDPAIHRTCIVPNYRMVDKTDAATSGAYLDFLIQCAQKLVEHGASPFVLVHEGDNDAWLAHRIAQAGGDIPVLKPDDPLEIKGVLGRCDATIGSRYHGLVSALSQGVPSLAIGWSHKYAELFEDYGFPQGVLSVKCSETELDESIDRIIGERSNEELRQKLLETSARLERRSEEMWDNVFAVIEAVR